MILRRIYDDVVCMVIQFLEQNGLRNSKTGQVQNCLKFGESKENRNFRICLCLEIGSKAQEAIPYCQKAISICNSRVQRLMNELNSLSGSTATSAASELDQTGQLSSNGSQSNDSIVDKKAEIETLTGLSGELEKKASSTEYLVKCYNQNISMCFADYVSFHL